MKNSWKLMVAVLLLPTVFFVLAETFGACWSVLKDFQTAVGFLAGGALYGVIHFAGFHFDRMYVWGHETTHAVAAMLFGFRVHSMTVNKDSGHVKMDRCNAAVVLAPYVVPLYALMAGLGYLALELCIDAAPYRPVFVFVAGFLMTFHYVQTVKTLWETQQPDLRLAGGRIFSVVMIVLCNAVVLTLVLKTLFPERVALGAMARAIAVSTYNTWKIVINYIMEHLHQAQA
ncbi:hypothetical protein [Candidatus Avelusimicrobium facis]|uniref:hypothetical protein n=1 Tax=Candidatus Avelusimicrobium facis TaxID=3416203 RepID=UPI0015B66C45